MNTKKSPYKGMTVDDLKVCNCADCGEVMVSPSHVEFAFTLPKEDLKSIGIKEIMAFGKHIGGRPFCAGCASWLRKPRMLNSGCSRRGSTVLESSNAGFDAAVRCMEDG